VFVAESYGLLPGIRALVFALAADVATQVALVYLILQLVSALLGTLFQRQLLVLVERLSPSTFEDSLARPSFLYAEALDDARTALDLVEKEQARLFGRLPSIIDAVRPDGETATTAAVLAEATTSIANQCDAFLTDILDTNHSRAVTLDVVEIQKR